MVPLAATSSNQAQARLGPYWRQLHQLAVLVFGLAVIHALLLGSSYLGSFDRSPRHWLAAFGLVSLSLATLLLRWRRFWPILKL